MLSPAFTVAASAAFVTVRSGQFTVMLLGPESLLPVLASLLAEAEALLLTVPQLADEVVALICTVTLPGARVPILQLRLLPLIKQLPPAVPPSTVQLKPPGKLSVNETL